MDTAGLIIIFTIIFIIIIIMKMQNRFLYKKLSRLFNQSSEMASRNDLRFSSQLVLNDMVLSVDGIHRKLLVVKEDAAYRIIDLNLVRLCTVHKEYFTIQAGALDNHTIEHYLKTISIQLSFYTGEVMSLPFYEKGIDHLHQAFECEAKARDWESMLNKLILKEKRA